MFLWSFSMSYSLHLHRETLLQSNHCPLYCEAMVLLLLTNKTMAKLAFYCWVIKYWCFWFIVSDWQPTQSISIWRQGNEIQKSAMLNIIPLMQKKIKNKKWKIKTQKDILTNKQGSLTFNPKKLFCSFYVQRAVLGFFFPVLCLHVFQ